MRSIVVYVKKLIQKATPVQVVVFFIVFAALLRLIFLTVAFYGPYGELYRDLQIIWWMFHFGELPLLGPSSIFGGFYFGAVYYYIEAFFVGLWGFRPFGAVFMSAFFSVFSLPVLYQLCLKWFLDKRVAIIAVAIQTIALFDIQNAYYISNPNLLPFFFLVFLLVLTKLIQEGKTWEKYALLGLLMGIGTQLHATGLVMFWIVFLSVHIYKKIKPSLIQTVVFSISMGIFYIPYFIYEFTHNFSLTKALFAIAGRAASNGSRASSVEGFFNFFASFFVFKDGFFTFYPSYVFGFAVAVVLTAILLGLMAYLILIKKYKPQVALLAAEAKLVLSLWLFGGLTMYLFFSVAPAYYYFLIMWPFPVIIFSWWLASLFNFSKNSFWVALCIYVILQFWCLGFFYFQIYRPEYSYKNLQKVFSYIQTQPNSSQSLVINKVLDINQFKYYLTLNKLTGSGVFGQNSQIYLIRSCVESPEQIGQKVLYKTTVFSKLCVDEYGSQSLK